MATKNATILARVEPEVKEQAESIMTKRIPFSLSLPKEPITLDSMTSKEFDSIMENGLRQAKSDQSRPVADIFADLRRELE